MAITVKLFALAMIRETHHSNEIQTNSFRRYFLALGSVENYSQPVPSVAQLINAFTHVYNLCSLSKSD